MAILTGKVKFTGRVGDLIGYKRNGVDCLRSMPLEVKQTNATCKAAKRFGEASHTGKLIRQAFAPYLLGKTDRSYVNRLNKAIIQSGVEGLRGYRFNQQSHISDFLQSPILGDDNILRITKILQPRHIKVTHMEYRLIAMRIDITTGKILQSLERSYMHEFVRWSADFKPIEFDANLPGKGTLIVVLQANPYQGKYPLYDKRYLATDIIKVEMPPANTVSKKQRRLQQKRDAVKQQTAQNSQYFGDKQLLQTSSELIVPIRNDTFHNSRLKEQRE
ncbi:hypothetical protein HHL16_22190 [Pseudoflavitalea sp. G-6-1-2]|uniref:hypothetical protein n=1 Tax=Pseudoflavitalea sp. G-6-1-2 TaxID=2728841 RepID=UPI00146A6D55|nr:hypothetical protein [Pseudoflavitalea sp. G-6-1-2]NML23606.1 hypothetical protein [Pseudoflavitalea sp. G-6-1-2]